MDIDPQTFLEVPLNSREKHACSPPEQPPSWRGVVIRAPRQVRFKKGEVFGNSGAFAAIPICGFFFVDAQFQGVDEKMNIISQDRGTGRIFSGPLIELDASPDEPPPVESSPDPEQLKGIASGGYFNPNLADFISFPHIPATYDVHIEFRGFKSNVVTIEIREDNDSLPIQIRSGA